MPFAAAISSYFHAMPPMPPLKVPVQAALPGGVPALPGGVSALAGGVVPGGSVPALPGGREPATPPLPVRPSVKPTLPTDESGGTPTGLEYRLSPKGTKDYGVIGENDAADKLAEAGYRVEHLPDNDTTIGNGHGKDNDGLPTKKNPDMLVEKNVFDVYTPGKETSIKTIINGIQKKTYQQAKRITLNLKFFSGDVATLKSDILRATNPAGNLKYLDELLVILSDGTIETWFVR